MSLKSYQPAKVFSVEQANAMLPLVRAITSDLVRLSRQVIERRQHLDQLLEGRDADTSDLYSDELSQVEQELSKDAHRLQEYVAELVELGVEPKSAPDGLIDFPAMLDGRLVYLCWKLDEPEVLYWHELDGGFAGRQPLTAASGSSGGTGVSKHICDQ